MRWSNCGGCCLPFPAASQLFVLCIVGGDDSSRVAFCQSSRHSDVMVDVLLSKYTCSSSSLTGEVTVIAAHDTLLTNTEYFCVEKCVSLWPAAREAARPTAAQQSPVPTHMATIHQCPPPTSTSLLPSILSFLIRSSHPRRLLSARSHSSSPATSTGAAADRCCTRLIAFPCVCLCLSSCVRALMQYTTPSPWWLLCRQWSVPPPLARQSCCQGCTPKASSCLCLISV